MDIATVEEGLHHLGVAAHVGHQAQLDLGIVGREQQVAGVGDERASYLTALFGAYGYVLEIGICGRNTPGGRHRLVESGVELAVARINEAWQGVHIGGQELAQAAYFKNQPHDRVGIHVFAELFFGGAPGAALCALGLGIDGESFEKHLAHLGRRGHVEGASGQLGRLRFKLAQACVHARGNFGQHSRVDAHALPFHAGEHGDEGQLHVGHERREAFGLDQPAQLGSEQQHGLGTLTHRLHSLRRRGIAQLAPGGGRQRIVGKLQVEIAEGGIGQVVAHLGVEHVACGRSAVVGRRPFDALAAQENHRALHVVGRNGGMAAEHGAQRVEHCAPFEIKFRHGGIYRLVAEGQGHALRGGRHGAFAGGVESHGNLAAGSEGAGHEFLHLRRRLGQAIAARELRCGDSLGGGICRRAVVVVAGWGRGLVEERELLGSRGSCRSRRAHLSQAVEESAEFKAAIHIAQGLHIGIAALQ